MTGTMTFDEAVQAFANDYPARAAAKTLADATGLTEKTVFGWLLGGKLPGGDVEIKVRSVLVTAGYQIDSYYQLSDLARDVADLIGFGMVETEWLADKLGYTGGKNGVFDFVLRGNSATRDKLTQMRQIVAGRREDLDGERFTWKYVMERERLVAAPASPAAAGTEPAPRATVAAADEVDDRLPQPFEAALAGFTLTAEVVKLIGEADRLHAEHGDNGLWENIRANLGSLSFAGNGEGETVEHILDALEIHVS